MINTRLGTWGWGLKSSQMLSFFSKAGLEAGDLGLKSPQTQTFICASEVNLEASFKRRGLLAPNPQSRVPCHKPQMELYA